MFNWLKIRKSQRSNLPLYIGDLAVVPRSDIHRYFEFDWEGVDTDVALRDWISETLELPTLNENNGSGNEFLIIDVLLSQYRTGSSGSFDVGAWGFFLLWRPSIRLQFRLREGCGNAVLGNYLVTKKMPWGVYLRKAISWRGIFNIGGVFKDEDVHLLLLSGLLEGMQWAKKVANT